VKHATQVVFTKDKIVNKLVQKALGLQMNGFASEAINIFESAIRKEPNNVILCEHYGAALASLGEFAKAKKYLKRALSASVVKPQVLNNLATVNRALGLRKEALLNINSALKFKPKYTDAWINKANIHGDLKQWDEAISSFTNAIELRQDDPGPYEKLSHAYLHNSEYHKALNIYKIAQEKFPLVQQFVIGELICYRAMKKYDQAIDFANKIKSYYNNELFWFEWLQTLYLAKEFSQLEQQSKIAIEKFGEFPAMMDLLSLREDKSADQPQ